MPSDLRNDYHSGTVGSHTYGASVDYRERSWANTVGYPLPKGALKPENAYTDTQIKCSQSAMVVYALGGYYDPWPVWRSITYDQGLHTLAGEGSSAMRTFSSSIFAGLDAKLRTTDALVNEAITKALLKAGDMKTNFAVTAVEASKTSSLILDTARRIDKAYRALRKGNLQEVAKQLNITPSRVHKTWLEYRYGWLPMLMDVKGSAELLAQHHMKRADRFTVSATVISEGNFSSVNTNSSALPLVLTNTYATAGSKTARVKLTCRVNNDALAAIQQMGLVNPALVAWELVPYSFVFDWFIQVGDWLTAQTALSGLDLIQAMSSVSYKRSGVANYSRNGYTHWTGSVYQPATADLQSRERYYTRQPLSSSSLAVYPVVVDDPFSLKKVVTSLALLRSSSSRFVRI